jgi:hypothetical protein
MDCTLVKFHGEILFVAECFAKSRNFLFLVFGSGYTDLCCPKIFPCIHFTVISSWQFFFTTVGALFPLDFIRVRSFRQICRPGLILPLRFLFVRCFGPSECQWIWFPVPVKLSASRPTDRALGADFFASEFVLCRRRPADTVSVSLLAVKSV